MGWETLLASFANISMKNQGKRQISLQALRRAGSDYCDQLLYKKGTLCGSAFLGTKSQKGLLKGNHRGSVSRLYNTKDITASKMFLSIKTSDTTELLKASESTPDSTRCNI